MSSRQSDSAKIPFLKFTLLFGIGTIIGTAYQKEIPGFLQFVPVINGLILFIFYFKNHRFKQFAYFDVLLYFTLIFIAALYANHHQKNRFSSSQIEKHNRFTGIVLDQSPATNQRIKYEVKLTAFLDSNSFQPTSEKIFLYSKDTLANLMMHPGKQVYFSGHLYPIQATSNPGQFDYAQYCHRNGIRYQTYINYGIQVLPGNHHQIKTYALVIRNRLLQKYKSGMLEGDEFAVLAALTLGEKSFLSKTLKQTYSEAGAFHVLAVSGLHVGIIFLVLASIMKPLKRIKSLQWLYFFLITLFLWTYAFISGLSPSVMRATTMFTVIVAGNSINQKTNIYNSLAFSAFVLMLVDPLILYNTGFQLSYAAVSSIVFFQPKIANLFTIKNKLLKASWNLAAVSFAAQFGTFPFSLFYFHQFPVYFWISNFLVIPAASILLYGAFLLLLLPTGTILFKWLAIALKQVLSGLNFALNEINQLPFAVVKEISFDSIYLLLFILLVFTVAIFVSNFKTKYFNAIMAICILLLTYSCVQKYQTQKQSILVFYQSSTPLLSFINGEHHVYYSPADSLSSYNIQLLNNATVHYNTGIAISIKDQTHNGTMQLTCKHLFIKNKEIALTNSESITMYDPIPCDILWNTSSNELSLSKCSNFYQQVLKNGKINVPITQSDKTIPISLNNNTLTLNIN